MKPLFRCDYCPFTGTEDEVREHEPKCMNNYDKESCYTCAHRGKLTMINGHFKYQCNKDIDIPEDNIYEYCKLYERVIRLSANRIVENLFGGFGF